MSVRLYFFFQAEDGIRDIGVTGVQTCALPIYTGHEEDLHGRTVPPEGDRSGRPGVSAVRPWARATVRPGAPEPPRRTGRFRSEERRVGKEWRSRGSAYHSKKKER